MSKTEGVPRGLLRFLVLKFLMDKPMSGAEIVEKIEQQTSGKWKPSPGSIYPLLSGLQSKGFTQEISLENSRKLYTLTEKGQEFFRNQILIGRKFMEKMEYLIPLLIEGYNFKEERLFSAKESAKKLLETFIELDNKKNLLTNENVGKIVEILDKSNLQLGQIIKDTAHQENKLLLK